MREFDARAEARKWKRPYSSVQWAWVRALGVEPPRDREEGGSRGRRRHRSRELREAMRQRHGVRGL